MFSSEYRLQVEVYRYTPTESLDLDIQPNYVRLHLGRKIFQLRYINREYQKTWNSAIFFLLVSLYAPLELKQGLVIKKILKKFIFKHFSSSKLIFLVEGLLFFLKKGSKKSSKVYVFWDSMQFSFRQSIYFDDLW